MFFLFVCFLIFFFNYDHAKSLYDFFLVCLVFKGDIDMGVNHLNYVHRDDVSNSISYS